MLGLILEVKMFGSKKAKMRLAEGKNIGWGVVGREHPRSAWLGWSHDNRLHDDEKQYRRFTRDMLGYDPKP